MRVLVTGGAGFIGSHLVDRLIQRGDDVRVIDNLSSGDLSFLEHHQSSEQFEFIEGDVCSTDDVTYAMKDIECVFHLAANPDIRLGTQITDTDLKQGTIATYNILESMRIEGVKTIAFASILLSTARMHLCQHQNITDLVCQFLFMERVNLRERAS